MPVKTHRRQLQREPRLESRYESGNSSMSRPFKCPNNSQHIHHEVHDSCWAHGEALRHVHLNVLLQCRLYGSNPHMTISMKH